jgi:hypothetical protein
LQHFAATSRATFGPPNLDQQFKKKQQDQDNQSSYCQKTLMCACDISWGIAMSINSHENISFWWQFGGDAFVGAQARLSKSAILFHK